MAEIHTLLIFLKRKAGLSAAEFQDYYEGHHVPLCLRYMAGPVVYKRRFLTPTAGLPEPDFDVITELGFPDVAMRDIVLSAMTADQMPADVIADELNFIDRDASRFYAADGHETQL